MLRLFISHSWKYSGEYERLGNLFNAQGFERGISYFDHSVPINDPIHTNGTDMQLENAIDAKIKGINCMIIMAGMYSNDSKWISKEIKLAQKYKKPIIAVEPFASQRTSQYVKDAASEVVSWNGKSIVSAIKRHSI